MKEKNEEVVVYHGKEHLFRRYFDSDTPTEHILDVFQKYFPQECNLWSRELIGGNKGAHQIND